MRRFIWLVLLLTAGCQNVRGPLAGRSPARVDDPHLSIEEQKQLARDRLALPEGSAAVLPPEAGAIPGR